MCTVPVQGELFDEQFSLVPVRTGNICFGCPSIFLVVLLFVSQATAHLAHALRRSAGFEIGEEEAAGGGRLGCGIRSRDELMGWVLK